MVNVNYHILAGACVFAHATTLKDARRLATKAKRCGGSAHIWADCDSPPNTRATITVTPAMRSDSAVANALLAAIRPVV